MNLPLPRHHRRQQLIKHRIDLIRAPGLSSKTMLNPSGSRQLASAGR
jgi:hypothetical protein